MITKEELKTYLDTYDRIEARAEYILRWYNDNIEKMSRYLEYNDIDEDNISYEEYYCEDTDYGYIPTKFLTMTEEELAQYAKEYNEEKEAKLAIEAKKLAKEKADRKELMESKEYVKFLKLKEKFEGAGK